MFSAIIRFATSVLKKISLILFGLVVLGGCRPTELYFVKPQGPPEYQLGWQDGCDSGLSAQGGIMNKMLYGFKKRPELGNSEQYKQGWNEGFTYCRFVLGANEPLQPEITR